MNKIIINVENPVWCKVLMGEEIIKNILSYTSKYVVQKQYGKEVKEYKASFLDKSFFYTGFLTKIEKYCKKNNIEIEIDKTLLKKLRLKALNAPTVGDIVWGEGKYAFQKEMIESCIKYQRGVIKSATGTGKTVMMMGLMSCFPENKILFVSDSKTPLMNLEKAMSDFSFNHNDLTISTIQGIYNKEVDFDIILIDECHAGMGSIKGMYTKFLTNSIAPMRIGFTGTLPDTELGKLLLEGLIGSVIDEFTTQEGHDIGILTKPKIILKMIEENSSLKKVSNYQDVYKLGIVNNLDLNRTIIKDVLECKKRKESVLILITNIEHGINLQDISKEFDLDLFFANGNTEMDIRKQIVENLSNKEIDGVIATSIFRKSMNIPSLDNVILAFGGKGESGILQAIGRGLRPSEGKEYTKIYDYYNPSNKHLINHFGKRLCIYFNEGWIGGNN